MMKSFRLISLCFTILLALPSCSDKVIPIKSGNSPLLNIDGEMQKFNMQINFRKQSFSGMLIVQRRADCEIRIVASTFFGPTLFDFGLKDGQFNVYSCIEPLRNKRIIQLFENDFKKLFLPNLEFRKVKSNEKYSEQTSGRNFGKGVFQIYKSQDNNFEKLTIKHAWIGVSINFERL